MAVETELYDLLGVSSSATESDIKKAYKKKAKEHHPDKNPNDPAAGEKFQEMAAAYEILVDSETRALYDQYGMEGIVGPGNGGMGADAADIFADIFGGSGVRFGFDFGGGGRQRKSQDSVIPYEVTLEDLYTGKVVRMNMEKEAVCGVCKGSGAKGSAKAKECVKCEGKGWVFVHKQIGRSQVGTSRAACPDCDGLGGKLREKDRCKKCKGQKTVKEKTRQEILVEKGMTNRQRIVLAGEGDQEPGVPAGDVVFVLKAKPHESFERSGNDLLTTVKITLSEALLGFSRILITHLDGRGVRVSSPVAKVVKSGDTIVLRGEGMPVYKRPEEKGDLYVVLELEMPDEKWMQSIDRQALESLLPPKKAELDPIPAVVEEAKFEASDIMNARARSFPAASDFFTLGGDEDEDAWEDEDEDEPECRHQ